MSSTIRPYLFCSVVLTSAGFVHANPAQVHTQVVQELSKSVGEAARVPEVKHAEQQARNALKRATEAQKASEPAQKACAPLLVDTALEWAQLRTELAYLSSLQAGVHAAHKRLSDAAHALKREQAYLEETEARRGRALALLEQLKAAKAAPTAASVPAEAAKPTQSNANAKKEPK